MTQQIAPAPGLEPTEPTAWSEVFAPFSLHHLLVVIGCAVATAVVVRLGVVWRGTDRERLLRRALGISVIVTQGASELYWMFVKPFNAREAFPLHLCDVAIWMVVIAMLTEHRWARTGVYFMGLALSTQGFFTPTLQYGFAHLEYWFFWFGHTQIVGSAIYFFIVNRYRPSARDFGVGVAITSVWLVVVFLINLAFDLNYGYVGRYEPENETIVQKLGPWPWRVLIMMGMTFVAYVAIWMIGAGVAKFEGKRELEEG